jgi:hypothetical protein
MASPLFDQIVTGRVIAANEKGIRLDVSDGWLNVSKFSVGVVIPEKGAAVAVTLDKGGFIRAVAPVDGAAPPTPAPLPVAGGSSGPSDKDRTITRLAVLKAAAEFAASRETLKSGEVLKIAESWERWVLRSDDLSDDLEKVF